MDDQFAVELVARYFINEASTFTSWHSASTSRRFSSASLVTHSDMVHDLRRDIGLLDVVVHLEQVRLEQLLETASALVVRRTVDLIPSHPQLPARQETPCSACQTLLISASSRRIGSQLTWSGSH